MQPLLVIWSHLSGHWTHVSEFTLNLGQIFPFRISLGGNIISVMLHYIHQLDTNSVYLPFGAGQIVYRWVFQSIFTEIRCLPCQKCGYGESTGTQNSKHWDETSYNTSLKWGKQLGDNCQWINPKWPLSRDTFIWSIVVWLCVLPVPPSSYLTGAEWKN